MILFFLPLCSLSSIFQNPSHLLFVFSNLVINSLLIIINYYKLMGTASTQSSSIFLKHFNLSLQLSNNRSSFFTKLSCMLQLTSWLLHYLQQSWLAYLRIIQSCLIYTDQDEFLLFLSSEYTSSVKLKGSVFLIS